MFEAATINKLNKEIKEHFPHLFPIKEDYKITHQGVSQMVMLDRYSQKDRELITLGVDDLVVTIVKEDPVFPARGIGKVIELNDKEATILLDESWRGAIEDPEEMKTGIIKRPLYLVDKPMEIYYEQIANRVGHALAQAELKSEIEKYAQEFSEELRAMNIVPAGRVLYGAGSGTEVTYFNCYVMPLMKDSRGGISDHRKEVMEIMSRGGGVGTNGSSLRPKGNAAKSVGGKSSGAVSWLHDLANLTHLVEQGGSRRGAQMIMMSDWHPDIIEFIVSKMQNPAVLQHLIKNSKDREIIEEAKRKLKFVPLSTTEQSIYAAVLENPNSAADIRAYAKQMLKDQGRYEVENPDFLTGANISVNISKEFMEAVENDQGYELRFPDTENLNAQEKEIYDNEWHEIGDVREWEARGLPVRVHRTIKAKDLWDLIAFCSTYSAEPGIFFIDNANDDTNAKAYGQKVVATNPCGEQPLPPYSVCNLAAINLANFVDRKSGQLLLDKLAKSVKTLVRLQDNVIDQTPYFLEANKKQALGERRVGLGVMGLHDMMIYAGIEYGSPASIDMINEVFKTISTTAYQTSIDLAKEKGSFPFLKDREAFINTGYMKKMPESIRQSVLKHGIRNSHLLTIAPTGSTGTMVNVSTGLEPYFSFSYFRSGRLGKFIEVTADVVQNYLNEHPEYSADNLPSHFVSAMDLSPEAHADVQTAIQYWIDSSISKTVNAPKGYTVEQVQGVYERLYRNKAKGGTVYVDGSRDSQVLTLTNGDEAKEIWKDDLKEIDEFKFEPKEATDHRSDRQDRNIGNDVGDLCPICLEGTVEFVGGCNTCTNCNAQLKCGL